MDTGFEPFCQHLLRCGLNLVGVVAAGRAADLTVRTGAERLLGENQSLLVCGSGGRAHWQALRPWHRIGPHPLDRHAARVLRRAARRLGAGARVLTPRQRNAFDLRRLAERAGWGAMSPYLHLLIHPVYGPWVGIRGVVATPAALPATPPLEGFDPCGPCHRPCLDACPAGAYARGKPWSFEACAQHRLRERSVPRHCADACHSRRACPVGAEHAYSDAEYRHRHRAPLGDIRLALAALLRGAGSK